MWNYGFWKKLQHVALKSETGTDFCIYPFKTVLFAALWVKNTVFNALWVMNCVVEARFGGEFAPNHAFSCVPRWFLLSECRFSVDEEFVQKIWQFLSIFFPKPPSSLLVENLLMMSRIAKFYSKCSFSHVITCGGDLKVWCMLELPEKMVQTENLPFWPERKISLDYKFREYR